MHTFNLIQHVIVTSADRYDAINYDIEWLTYSLRLRNHLFTNKLYILTQMCRESQPIRQQISCHNSHYACVLQTTLQFFSENDQKVQNHKILCSYLESACKMHQNEYKHAYVWSSGSWDNMWYFHKHQNEYKQAYVWSSGSWDSLGYLTKHLLSIWNM